MITDVTVPLELLDELDLGRAEHPSSVVFVGDDDQVAGQNPSLRGLNGSSMSRTCRHIAESVDPKAGLTKRARIPRGRGAETSVEIRRLAAAAFRKSGSSTNRSHSSARAIPWAASRAGGGVGGRG